MAHTIYKCPHCGRQVGPGVTLPFSKLGKPVAKCQGCGKDYRTGAREWVDLSEFRRFMAMYVEIPFLGAFLPGIAMVIVVESVSKKRGGFDWGVFGAIDWRLYVAIGLAWVFLSILLYRSTLKEIDRSLRRKPAGPRRSRSPQLRRRQERDFVRRNRRDPR